MKAMDSWPSEGIICFIYHVKSFLRMDYHFYDWSIKRQELGGAKVSLEITNRDFGSA